MIERAPVKNCVNLLSRCIYRLVHLYLGASSFEWLAAIKDFYFKSLKKILKIILDFRIDYPSCGRGKIDHCLLR